MRRNSAGPSPLGANADGLWAAGHRSDTLVHVSSILRAAPGQAASARPPWISMQEPRIPIRERAWRPLWKRPVCCRKQRQRVTEQGYLALDGICPQDEVGYIRATLMDMFENRTGYNEGAQYDFISRTILPGRRGFPACTIRAIMPRPAEDDVPRPHPGDGAPAAGPDAALYGEHALLKPGGAGPRRPGTRTRPSARPTSSTRS